MVTEHAQLSAPTVAERIASTELTRFQLKDMQAGLREVARKQEMKEMLTKQIAEKRMRERKQHAQTYGQPRKGSDAVGQTRAVALCLGDKSASRSTDHQAELEAAIMQKQLERRELRKVAQQERRRLNEEDSALRKLLVEQTRIWQVEAPSQTRLAH